MQKRTFLISLPLSFKPPTEHTDAYGEMHCINCILLKTQPKLGEIYNEKHCKIPKTRYTNRMKLPIGADEPEILKPINQIRAHSYLEHFISVPFSEKINNCIKNISESEIALV